MTRVTSGGRQFLCAPRLCVLFPLAAVLCLGLGCNAVPVSSPEGTTTKYVEDRRVLVYAPRAARARKVVFDTPDKQLIHQRDTPLRRFFDARAADFSDVDYAKSTILEDILARLENREYVHAMVRAVVERHDSIRGTGVTPELLADALYQSLTRRGYPQLRSDDIGDFIDLLAGSSAPTGADREDYNRWRDLTRPSRARELFLYDLELSLKEHRYFRRIIEEACEKRLSLFKIPGSPVAALGAAQAKLKAFVVDNLTTQLAEDFAKGKLSLWEAFLEDAARTDAVLVKGTDPTRWTRFKSDLRSAVQAQIDSRKSLDEAMRIAARKQPAFIKPVDETTQSESILSAFRDALEADPKVTQAYARLEALFTSDLKPAIAKRNETEKAHRKEAADLRLAKAATRQDRVEIGSALTTTTAAELLAIDAQFRDSDPASFLSRLKALHDQYDGKLGSDEEWSELLEATAAADGVAIKLREQRQKLEQALEGAAFNSGPGASATIVEIQKAPQDPAPLELLRSKVGPFLKKLEEARTKDSSLPDPHAERTAWETQWRPPLERAVAHGIATRTQLSSEEGARFQAVVDAYRDYEQAELARTEASDIYDDSVAEFDSRVFDRDQFLAAIEAVVTRENAELSDSERQDLAAVLESIEKALRSLVVEIQEGVKEALPNRTTFLATITKFDVRKKIEPSVVKLAERFASVFRGYPSFVTSDKPIFETFLERGGLGYKSEESRKIAARTIPPAVRKSQKDTASETQVALADRTTEFLAKPEAAYLFGSAARNHQVVKAFQEELYHAFKHQLGEARAAERPIDYDYWWLTFFPKAIPLGEKKIEGESVVEIGFPERIIPMEQYHRWLQDQRSALDPEPGVGCQFWKKDQYWELRIAAATDVLTGFLVVLDASELTSEYPDIRPVLLRCIAALTDPAQPDAEQRYCGGLRVLLREIPIVAPKSTWTLDRGARQETAASKLGQLEMLTAKSAAAATGLRERTWFERRIQQLEESIERLIHWRRNGTTSDLQEESAERRVLEESDAGWKRDSLQAAYRDSLEVKEALHFLQAVSSALGDDCVVDATKLECAIEDYGGSMSSVLAQSPFSVPHILYAVVSATENNELLPIKVELYLSAHFPGIERFRASRLERGNYVVPKRTSLEKRSLRRFLEEKGVTKISLDLLEDKVDGEKESVSVLLRRLDAEKPQDKAAARDRYFPAVSYTMMEDSNVYLRFPELWLLELQLAQSKADLRQTLVHVFQSSYPAVPDPQRIKGEFVANDRNLRSTIYLWLRDLWRATDQVSDRTRQGVVRRFLDHQDYLTPNVRLDLEEQLSSNHQIHGWMDAVTGNSQAMDQLAGNLLDSVYGGLWEALALLADTQRREVPYEDIEVAHYKRFQHWGKPRAQQGIQVVDLLPASRDDLVAMSINEGGAVVKAAAQAQGAAAYDVNRLETIRKNAQLLVEGVRKEDESGQEESGTGTLEDLASKAVSGSESSFLQQLAEESLAGETKATSLGATGRGGFYARAKAALAYSRRREYLDAAITAAGRGDNFAKWVIRKSDLRSELADAAGETLVAAAHNGYPNGDQPFHMLVRIPHDAIHQDWAGRSYVLFNSSYSATMKVPYFYEMGQWGLLLKLVAYLVYYPLVDTLEDDMVGTKFPFQWNAKSHDDQNDLLTNPNALGGRILLDDSDKIKYSEVRRLIAAEAGFIKATRSAQLSEVGSTLSQIEKEAPSFANEVREALEKERQAQQSDNPPSE